MQFEILGAGAFGSLLVHLEPGEKFISESGAMFRASANVDIDVTTKSGGRGGFFSGIKRMFSGEGFFFSTYSVTDGQPGEVGLAPTHQGEIYQIPMDGSSDWICTGGSYLASTEELATETNFQGLKGIFSGESLAFLRVTGVGDLFVSAFGRISAIDIDEELVVDTGHVVAFESTLEYSISKAGGSWIQSWLVGEGLVLRFKGQGRIYVQSHNPSEYGRTLGPKLPER